jgi:hypothetical protein
MRLVIAHGRDQAYQIPSTLGREWSDALGFGLERVEYPGADTVPIAFAFYGDIWRADDPGHARRQDRGESIDDQAMTELLELDRKRGIEAAPTALEMAIAQDLSSSIFDQDRLAGTSWHQLSRRSMHT